jgi:hypothetical protein
VDCGSDHPADDGRRNGFHYIGAHARLPQNGNKTCQNDADRHEFRAEAMDSPPRSLPLRCARASEVCHLPDDDSVLRVDRRPSPPPSRPRCQTRDVSDPDGHAEVVAKQPVQNEAAGQRVALIFVGVWKFSCHGNVTQDAENTGNCEANDRKRRRKQIARSCPNLLNPFD